MVEYLPSKLEALSLNSSTTEKPNQNHTKKTLKSMFSAKLSSMCESKRKLFSDMQVF
jgi:hypothetical protein